MGVKKQRKKIKLGLSLLTANLSLISLGLSISFVLTFIIGLLSPNSYSTFQNGLRTCFLGTIRFYFQVVIIAFCISLIILNTGSYLEITYHTRKFKPLRNIRRVRFVTICLVFTFMFIAFMLLGFGYVLACYIFGLVCAGIMFSAFQYSCCVLLKELRSNSTMQRSEFIQYVENVRKFSLISFVFAVSGFAIIAIDTNPGHGLYWYVVGEVFASLALIVLLTAFGYNSTKSLTANLVNQTSFTADANLEEKNAFQLDTIDKRKSAITDEEVKKQMEDESSPENENAGISTVQVT